MAHNTFHVALYVQDLDAAVARYRKLLGQEPAKVRHDYAKFEIADPPVILSLNTGGEPGTVSHLGIRYPGTGDVASELVRAKQEQLELLEQKGHHLLLRQGGQVLGPGRRRAAVGDVHAARRRPSRDGRGPAAPPVPRSAA
jgi:catechol 2,3-dioxygenase-like lactoylglutathione lyase family enzyme